ncbi:SgcJ/EcaC family oxidoreductase [Kribbella speibonae]|uniref:SgcJ/EcaC family oxidoreductase n=1 Tax=Kribbella speibonae TaxID=1572660 RepID=A0A4R0J997_9ACTN|nr:SgcJ/EcaC family oxidoreductase [Kribbella speibonae]TCC20908.1 SgcJ/EcaC family oxidoreductase [Kribbella speibonae]TCC40908.1 SgcJ/EcaC family oxidoreductase [Kribbella speibonae]
MDNSREADIAAIEEVVAAVEHAQNNELPDEFLSLFRADAIWTTGGGKRLFGLEAISTFTRQVLPGGMQGMTVTFELEHVLFLRPDVVAVKVRQVYRTPDGPDVGTPLWVMTKEDGRWLLTACQNTGVLEDELVTDAESRPVFNHSK